MPKVVKYPRLKTRIRKGRSGQVWVCYYYDMRPEGKSDVALGTDYEKAIQQWDELHNKRQHTVGRLEEAFKRWEDNELPKYINEHTHRGYSANLGTLRPVFGQMTWDEIDLPSLRQYLDLRTAKTQGNREMSLLQLIWGKALLWGMTRVPWPARGIKSWKNEEFAREYEITDEMFRAVYAQGDQVLRTSWT